MSEITGKIYKVFDIETFQSGFQKKSLVIETDSQYPQKVIIEFLSDKIDLINSLKTDDVVKISYNINGKEWTSPQGEVKYFNSIIGWRVEKSDGTQPTNTSNSNSSKVPTATPQDAFEDENENHFSEEEDDELPF